MLLRLAVRGVSVGDSLRPSAVPSRSGLWADGIILGTYQ